MSDIVTLTAVLLGSALAIALVIGLNAMLGGWAPSRIDSADAAAQALERDILGFRAGAEGVAAAARGAGLVLEADGGRLGLALSLGDGIVSRALRPGEVRGAQAQGERLVIRIDDFTLPSACITLTNEDEARLWAGRITRFARGEPQEI